MADVTTHAVRVRTVAPPTPRADPIAETARRVSDLSTGLASLAAGAASGALDRYWPGSPSGSDAALSTRIARATIGIALVTERRVLGAGAAVETLAQRSVEVARGVPIVRDVMVGLDGAVDRWIDRGDAERSTRERAATDFIAVLVPALVDGLIHRIDIAAVVERLPLADLLDALDLDALLEHVDLNSVMNAVDVDAIIGRVDIDGLLDRVDINRLMDHVDIDRLMLGIDLDALMGRIDLDALMGRIDLDALMGNMELGPMVANILDEVDIGGIVRDSTGSITTDAVDGARVGAMKLDSFVARLADRALLRGDTHRNPPRVAE